MTYRRSPLQKQNKLRGRHILWFRQNVQPSFNNSHSGKWIYRHQVKRKCNKNNFLLWFSISDWKKKIKLPYAHALAQKLLLQNQLQIAGRLKHFYQGWEVLARDQSIPTIAMGYQMPFLSQTNQEKLPRKLNSNQKEKEEVSSEIKKPSWRRGIVSNIFLVKKKHGSNRPVVS